MISVVMPAYNNIKFIKVAITSVLNQIFKNFEFIIIDDHSDDGTFEVIKKYSKLDNRIKIIQNKKNMGISYSRNIGIKNSKGKYIATMDSDDICHVNRLEEQYEFLENHKDVGVVGSAIELIDKTGKIVGTRKYHLIDKDIRSHLFSYSPFAQPATMLRKSILDKVGYYSMEYPVSADIDLWFRVGKISKYANLNKFLLKYRLNEDSVTYKKIAKMEKITFQIRWKAFTTYGYRPKFKEIIVNILQLISFFLVPTKVKVYLFNLWRNNRIG